MTPGQLDRPRNAHPIIVVMGVSGSGKSTVAELLADQLGWDYLEGDDLHPAANVAKMSAGIPLDDDDRWPWLEHIAEWISQHHLANRPGVVTCSALKRAYRDRLSRNGGLPVIFAYLSGSKAEITARLAARHGHFMPTALLASQFATLQPPEPDEATITVRISSSPTDEAAEIAERLGLQAD